MSYATDRVQLFDRDMSPLRELAPNEVFSRKRTEEINGEHELVITTTRKLEEGWRALTVDGMGKWREWVVTEIDEDHASGKTAMGTYRFVWSLQYDLTYSYAHTHAEIGYGDTPKTASAVAAVVLEGVSDWIVGSCDAGSVPSGSGAVMIYESAWSRLTKAVECLDCEVDAEIEVSNLYGVTARKLRLVAHVGNETATRRFDWGHDLTDIKRTPDPGPYYCRVVPLGKGETEYAEDDETTFEWPMDITDETGDADLYYIEDTEAAQTFRIKKSDETYYYPTIAVDYDEDDPELLLNAAREDLYNHTRPGVTYEASVTQFAQAGMDVQGVQLGDEVQCVDTGFNEEAALRIQGRVIKIEVDELSPETSTQLTIGQLRDNITSVIATIGESFEEVEKRSEAIGNKIAQMGTSRYIDELLGRINAEINATGGYSYFVPGEGFITYDTAVSDPLIGSEATKVVQIKGGSIRIADTKNSGFAGIDDWAWKTVFTSGHITAELVTAAQLMTGYIGTVNSDVYWDLDNELLVVRNGTIIGDTIKGGTITLGGPGNTNGTARVLDAGLREVCVLDSSGVAINGDLIITKTVRNSTPISGYTGDYINGIAQVTDGTFYPRNTPTGVNGVGYILRATDNRVLTQTIQLYPAGGYAPRHSVVFSNSPLELQAQNLNTATSYNERYMSANGKATKLVLSGYNKVVGGFELYYENLSTPSTSADPFFAVSTGGVIYCDSFRCDGSASSQIDGNVTVGGTFRVTGTKNRIVETNDYGTLSLAAYETPTPMFGDVGSGKTDGDGICYVQVDDMFSETANTDKSYQVFLQKCGPGDIWVSEKNPTHFVVEGTPNLSFDWEIKTTQRDYENIRMDNIEYDDEMQGQLNVGKNDVDAIVEMYDEMVYENPESAYGNYIEELESIYAEEITNR